MRQIKMLKVKVLFFIFWILFCASAAFAYGLEIGANAPCFKVVSGDAQALTLEDIKGKATGIFYETTDVVGQNSLLKEALGKYYQTQPEAIRKLMVRLPVINCSRVLWLFAGVYRSQFRKHSQVENITIYADWSGKMFSAYDIEDAKSNVFLIDKKGIIRYYRAGKIEGKEIEKVVSLFKELVEE